jgi:replicative DNA helicase
MFDSTPPLLGLSQRLPPSNVAAEQALLGALLANNKTYERVSDYLASKHFADPRHGRIFAAIGRRIEAGHLADAVTLKAEFEHSGALEEVGGSAYLAQLLTAMVGIINAGEYGRTIHDAWLRRQLVEIGEVVVNRAFGAEPTMDGGAQLEAVQAELFALASGTEGGGNGQVMLGAAVDQAVDEGEGAARGDRPAAPSTGLPSLDRCILRLRPGHLIVWGGRPGMGKTALARSIALNVSAGLSMSTEGEPRDEPGTGLPVAYFALEETSGDFGAAAIAQLAGVPMATTLAGQWSKEEAARVVRAQDRMRDVPLAVFDRPHQSAAKIASACRGFARRMKRPPGLVVIDYLQLVADPPGQRDKRLATGENAYSFKALAKELGCAVLLLSQLSRALEDRSDRRPTLRDLRESGAIEDAADVVIFPYRESYYLKQDRPKRGDDSAASYRQREIEWAAAVAKVDGHAEILIPKVRRGDAPTSCNLFFDGRRTRFEESAR